MDVDINNLDSVHCVGIGGIGVSAIARLLVSDGIKVTGTNDRPSPQTLKSLEEQGVKIDYELDISAIPEDTDLIIYSLAWDQNEPEFMHSVRSLEIPLLTYPQALGLISKRYRTVAISGTHGKTTTTAMIATILADTALSPNVLVGSLMSEAGSNFIRGDDDVFVTEACEYQRGFLNINPETLVITNIDRDHLDYFDGLADIQDAFRSLAQKVPETGSVICNPSLPAVTPAVEGLSAKVVDYTDIDGDITIPVPGKHNIANAQAAITTARILGVEEGVSKKALEDYRGTWRRSEYKGRSSGGAVIYDDYGHHPTEVNTTLEGFKDKFPDKKLIVVFQPHLFSRTKKLLNDFAGSFSAADHVLILPIYAAREAPDLDISSEDLVEKLKENHNQVEFVKDFADAQSQIDKLATADSLILTQGAGDVYEIADKLTSNTN